MYTTKRTIFALTTIFLLVFSLYATAQPNAPTAFTVRQIEIKPGTQAMFETFAKKYKEAADQLDDVASWNATVEVIGNTNRYLFIRPINSFVELADEQPVLERVYTADEVAALYQTYSEVVISEVTQAVYSRPDLSLPAAEPLQQPEIYLATVVDIKSGAEAVHEEYARKLIDASADTGVSWNTLKRALGDRVAYIYRIGLNWSDLDSPEYIAANEILAKFGDDEGARINAESAGATLSYRRVVQIPRPDLSHTQ